MVSRDIMRSSTRGFKKYYSPDLKGELRLDTNTNALGANPAAQKFMKEQKIDLNEYPGTYSNKLRIALADFYELDMENFVAGSGSDEMLDILFKTFTEWEDDCLIPYPSYNGMYDYFVQMNGGKVQYSELTDNFQLDVDSILSSKAKIVVLATPNNPTGNSFRQKDIEEILEGFKGIVVVDEAYGEYTKSSMIPRVNEFDNLVVTRTFSKAYAIAGLRIGYAVANLDLADMMNAVKIPYSLNSISEGAAIAAIGDQDFIRRSVELVDKERPKLAAGLKKLGFGPFPSDSNFILARCPIDHDVYTKALKEKKILIRDFGNKRRMENCVRFTVGTDKMNKELLDKTKKILEDYS
ncbi:aspartate aminotransferase [Candidatus Methanoplasma termitum]|uniref:Histidinol-phosphate aminotransferase n=1 Tax=Candidatus Methanoplasma termitum TaxID=1577791 RepID=A0A0A7LF76_9ARCH|nr:histidinol-phosphate transaminase [Candidatus Methanoplasma termitum]AIZ56141.1 aspartate aminotransferase [Candidatus Methanoplasma termitum]MCL2333470.1 histidinol-phosphate transaminase [Candidatus Methanoplasma sp.]